MTITAIADDEPERTPSYQWIYPNTGYTITSWSPPPGYHSYDQLAAINARIRTVLAEIKAGAHANTSRDYGRGMSYAVGLIEDAMKGIDR